jgi:poly(A) polymerase
LVDQVRFRAGFDFLCLRAEAGEVDVSLADWWQEFSTADDAMRHDLIEQLNESEPAPKRRRKRRRPAPDPA